MEPFPLSLPSHFFSSLTITTDEKLRGSHRTGQLLCASSTFASGLRSEHFSHSRSILAGSSRNRLSSVSEIRLPSSLVAQRLFLPRVRTGGYDVGFGLGIRCNDWVDQCCFDHLLMVVGAWSHPSAHFAAQCYRFPSTFWWGSLIVTRFRLLFVCRVIFCRLWFTSCDLFLQGRSWSSCEHIHWLPTKILYM